MSWPAGKGAAPTFTLTQLQQNYIARSFGMFIHFGMSTFDGSEQASNSLAINTFNPTALDIQQWATVAKSAKMKYAVLTAKHSGGFCLWPSAQSSYNISGTSWYASNGNMDIVREFVRVMRLNYIAPFLYFLNYDTTFEAAHPGFTQADYLAYNQAQLTELMGYGVGGIWLDGAEWFYGSAYPWSDATARFNFFRGINSQCLLVNNAQFAHDQSHSDIVEYESPTGSPPLVVPNGNTTPAEQCETIQSNSWFWHGETIKTASYIVNNVATYNAAACNYLLDCPPDTTGQIPSAVTSVLSTVGTLL